jgi:hypothetical protein
MKEYVFDVKMYAYIRVNAPDRKSAEAALTAAMDNAELSFSIMDENGTGQQVTAPVYVDDIEFPFLTEVDGVSVDDLDDEALDDEEPAP